MQKVARARRSRPSRRQVLQGIAGLGVSGAGLALLAGCSQFGRSIAPAVGEPPPETRTLKLDHRPSICVAPQYVAEELLRSEGFTDIRYIAKSGPKQIEPALASGEIDIAMHFAAPNVLRIEAGDRIAILAGGHIGCFELFGVGQMRSIRDLKGKAVAVSELGGPSHVFLSSMAAYVGLDPRADIDWTLLSAAESMQRLEAGTIDAFLGFPPEPQVLRARHVGHSVVNSALDKPWSQYFCCMVTGNREFVQRHPVATKRALRAILKAADLCAEQPEVAARALVDKGYATQYDDALQLMKELPYGRWRELDPEDTVRFYSLRLQEIGMIKSTPDRIIQNGTDWRFLNELKRELKA
jgi:NitT/TauT family transport system substrate-binding protein